MTLKKLILIGSISVVAITAAIVIPVAVTKSNQSNNTHQSHPEGSGTVDDDKLGKEVQEALDECYEAYHNAALSNSNIVNRNKDLVYVSANNELEYTSDIKEIYRWSMNSGVWDYYSSTKIKLTPVVEPEQQFNGYYVYYKA